MASSKTDDFSFLLASHPEMSEELEKLVEKRQMRLSRYIHRPNPITRNLRLTLVPIPRWSHPTILTLSPVPSRVRLTGVVDRSLADQRPPPAWRPCSGVLDPAGKRRALRWLQAQDTHPNPP